jgi:patatin-like phospholipase/acyl hydrolase
MTDRIQLLSLSGGGYRGLYTAGVLVELEKAAGRPIGQCFELIAGTSIGGILALAVAFEVKMQTVAETFEAAGLHIFPDRPSKGRLAKFRNLISDYRRPQFDADPLREVIETLIGKETLLGDAKHPLLIPSVNLTEGRPQVFKTRHYDGAHRDWQLKAVEIGLATSAAPTFFPPARIGNCLYADGGLFANSPDLAALHEATHFLGKSQSDCWLMSVGTTTTKYSVPDDPAHSYGIGFWVADDQRRLPNVIISAQQQFAEQIASHDLGDRYLKIETAPSHEQAMQLGLAKAGPIATSTLLGLGHKAGTDALGVDAAIAFLRHTAANLLLPRKAA